MALNKVDPKKVFKTCSTLDSAIDEEATGKEGLKNFAETYDTKFLKFKEGEYPTLFCLTNIFSSDQAIIKQDHMKIEFPELEGATEEELKKIKLKELKPKVTQVRNQEMMIKYFNYGILTYEENGKSYPCNANMFEYPIVQEMGSIVMMRTQLGDNLKNVLGS